MPNGPYRPVSDTKSEPLACCPVCGHPWEDHDRVLFWPDDDCVEGQNCLLCECQVFGWERDDPHPMVLTAPKPGLLGRDT